MKAAKMIKAGVFALAMLCAGAAAFAKTVETTMQSGKKVSTSIPNSNDRFEYKMDVRSAGTMTVKLDMSSVNFDVFFLLEKDIGGGFRKDHLQWQGLGR